MTQDNRAPSLTDILTAASGNLPPVLEIDLEEAPQVEEDLGVRISGIYYPYAVVNSWSLAQRNRFASLWNQMGALEGKPEVTAEDETRYEELSRSFLIMCVPTITNELASKLKASNRTAVAMDFFLKVAVRHPVFRTLAGFTQRTGTN